MDTDHGNTDLGETEQDMCFIILTSLTIFTSLTILVSIIIRKSFISKVFIMYLFTHQGHISQIGSTVSLTDSLTLVL